MMHALAYDHVIEIDGQMSQAHTWLVSETWGKKSQLLIPKSYREIVFLVAHHSPMTR